MNDRLFVACCFSFEKQGDVSLLLYQSLFSLATYV